MDLSVQCTPHSNHTQKEKKTKHTKCKPKRKSKFECKSGAIKWITEVVNLKISYQFYFGSFVFELEISFFFSRYFSLTRRKELRAQFDAFLKYKKHNSPAVYRPAEHEKESDTFVYRNASDGCCLVSVLNHFRP